MGMLEAGLTVHELGEELAAEAADAVVAVAAADGAAERSCASLREAERRVGILVCGVFFKLRGRGKGKGSGKRGKVGSSKKRVRDGVSSLIELRGAKRRAEVSREVEAACSREGGWGCDWHLSQGMEAQYQHPVPYWSWRPLCPGEWREGTGGGVERVVAKRKRLEIGGGVSREQRMRVLAEASGTFNILLNLGWGRYIGPRPILPVRVEDTSGVT